jgi:hypothetical protein
MRPRRNKPEFGDFIIYVDESGDHSLTSIDQSYPVFVLAFCLVEIDVYTRVIAPDLQALKFRYFGHDLAVLHERDIRKAQGDFTLLFPHETKTKFQNELGQIIANSSFSILASPIDKNEFAAGNFPGRNPYSVALGHGLRALYKELEHLGQAGRTTLVVVESRGPKEDKELRDEFRTLMELNLPSGIRGTFELVSAHKSANCLGLQLADLVARPIGVKSLRPDQTNRAFEVIQAKLLTVR